MARPNDPYLRQSGKVSKPYHLRRAEVLGFVTQFIAEHGYSPTVREICAATDMTTGGLYPVLQQMLGEGLLTGNPTQSRTLRPRDATMPARGATL